MDTERCKSSHTFHFHLLQNSLIFILELQKADISKVILKLSIFCFQVDIFNGLNNDILAREGLVALDMKHSVSPGPPVMIMTMMIIMMMMIMIIVDIIQKLLL